MAQLAKVRPAAKESRNYHYQKLNICRKCQRYSVLQAEICPVCEKPFKKVYRLVRKNQIHRLCTEMLWLITIIGLGVIFSPKLHTIYYAAAGALFWVSYLFIAFIYRNSEYDYQLKKRLRRELRHIQAGIRFDFNLAVDERREGKLEAAYEKLLEIREFVDRDEVKNQLVIVLNELPLRKKLDIELEKLIPAAYNPNFVKYALKVLTSNRARVTKKCIAYMVRYRANIEMEMGREPLLAIADTALRMKLYILEFSAFIEEHLEDLPKERIRRLCSLFEANPNTEWGSIRESTMKLAVRKYGNDPDFKRVAIHERAISRT